MQTEDSQPKKIGVTSPPYEEGLGHNAKEESDFGVQRLGSAAYGKVDGQIGLLKASKKEPEEGFDITQYCHCEELYWFGCYGSEARYKKYVTPESFRHPAKAAFRLTERIFQHLEQLGLLKQGDTVIDFMSGSGRINLVAAMKGYRTVAVELEPHFVKMIDRYVCDGKMRESKIMTRCGETDPEKKHDAHYCMVRDFRNRFDKWQDTSVEIRVLCDGVFREYYRQDCYYFHEELDHSAHEVVGNMNILARNLQRPVEYTVIQGDSRNLSQLLEKSGVGVISPPYRDTNLSGGDLEARKQRLREQGLTSTLKEIEHRKSPAFNFHMKHYSDNPSNIGNLPDLAAVTSVPYSQHDDRVSKGKIQGGFVEDCLTRTYEKGNHSKTEGNIADLPDKAGVISPPHENTETPIYSAGSMVGKGLEDHMATRGSRNRRYGAAAKVGVTSPTYDNRLADNDLRQFMDGEGRFKRPQTSYGGDKTNIGNKQGETYMDAMTRVYSEAFKAGISPLCTITKNPTRNHVLRRLDLDTIKLITTCHELVYCNDESHYSKELSAEDCEDNQVEKDASRQGEGIQSEILGENQSYGETVIGLQSGKEVSQMPETNNELGEGMPPTPSRRRTLRDAHRRDESQDQSKESASSDNGGTQDAYKRGASEALREHTQEKVLLPSLRKTTVKQIKPEMQATLPDSRVESENEGEGKTETASSSLEQRQEIPTTFRRKQSELEGRFDTVENRAQDNAESRMAETQNDDTGKGQLHMSEMREGGVRRSSSEALENERGSDNRLSDNSMQEMSLQGRRRAEPCPICGKWKIPEGYTLDQLGYVLYDYHRAVLYDFEVNETLDGSQATDYHGRLSFFKRLSLANGNTAAQFEDVLIAVIPNKHGVAGAISPPYRDSAVSPQGGGTDQRFNDSYRRFAKTGDHEEFQEAMSREASSAGYSRDPRNIGNLKDG